MEEAEGDGVGGLLQRSGHRKSQRKACQCFLQVKSTEKALDVQRKTDIKRKKRKKESVAGMCLNSEYRKSERKRVKISQESRVHKEI